MVLWARLLQLPVAQRTLASPEQHVWIQSTAPSAPLRMEVQTLLTAPAFGARFWDTGRAGFSGWDGTRGGNLGIKENFNCIRGELAKTRSNLQKLRHVEDITAGTHCVEFGRSNLHVRVEVMSNYHHFTVAPVCFSTDISFVG